MSVMAPLSHDRPIFPGIDPRSQVEHGATASTVRQRARCDSEHRGFGSVDERGGPINWIHDVVALYPLELNLTGSSVDHVAP